MEELLAVNYEGRRRVARREMGMAQIQRIGRGEGGIGGQEKVKVGGEKGAEGTLKRWTSSEALDFFQAVVKEKGSGSGWNCELVL